MIAGWYRRIVWRRFTDHVYGSTPTPSSALVPRLRAQVAFSVRADWATAAVAMSGLLSTTGASSKSEAALHRRRSRLWLAFSRAYLGPSSFVAATPAGPLSFTFP
jgi:hypothetical protein